MRDIALVKKEWEVFLVLISQTNLHVSQKADVHELRELQVRRRLNPSVSKKENEWLVIECVEVFRK